MTLETVIPGTSTWRAAPFRELLPAVGAALARVHAVALEPQPHLPFRPRPIAVDDFAADRRAGRMPTTPLLRLADERIRASTPPDGPIGFVHGDVWPGNTVVAGRRFRALIDWKTAGVGDPGVDVGELRKQVAIQYGRDAPELVGVAYWDVVAALNTPTELYSPQATRRRDDFLRAAVDRL